MRDPALRDLQTGRMRPGELFAGLIIFVLAALILFSNCRLYELRQENQEALALLEEAETRLTELRRQASEEPDAHKKALDMGLIPADPKDTVILHLRSPGT